MNFSVESYLKLENAIKQQAGSGSEDALDDLGFLKKAVLSFSHYVYMVSEEQIETRLAKGIKTGDEYRELAAHFDSGPRADNAPKSRSRRCYLPWRRRFARRNFELRPECNHVV